MEVKLSIIIPVYNGEKRIIKQHGNQHKCFSQAPSLDNGDPHLPDKKTKRV